MCKHWPCTVKKDAAFIVHLIVHIFAQLFFQRALDSTLIWRLPGSIPQNRAAKLGSKTRWEGRDSQGPARHVLSLYLWSVLFGGRRQENNSWALMPSDSQRGKKTRMSSELGHLHLHENLSPALPGIPTGCQRFSLGPGTAAKSGRQ